MFGSLLFALAVGITPALAGEEEAAPLAPLVRPNIDRSKPVEPRAPHYDSRRPQDTEKDWLMDEFCAWLGAKYDWTARECVDAKPET